MGLWAKASRARRTGRGILFIGPPWLPEAHFIGTLQHRVSPDINLDTTPARNLRNLYLHGDDPTYGQKIGFLDGFKTVSQ